ncbi:MAG: hypothetical protein M1353_07890 [Nitrospirae bacterium]|nr:hypothetical protein [Nitrospirota bacterium]
MKIDLRPEWKENEGANALESLVRACFRHQGGSTMPLIDFLCGLWNGYDYRPDMQLLCGRIETEHFRQVIEVMLLIRTAQKEAHEFFIDGGRVFEALSGYARRYGPVEEVKNG